MKIHYPNTPASLAGGPTLRLDQLEAIYRVTNEIKTGTKAALIGAGMGSGKTVVSTEIILKTKPKRALVVGVRDAYGQWAKTLREQSDGAAPPLLRIDNTEAGRANLTSLIGGEPGLFYVGLEMLRAQDWGEREKKIEFNTSALSPEVLKQYGLDENPLKPIATTERFQKLTFKGMKPVDLLISDESHKHSNHTSAALKTVRTIPAKAKVALSGTFFNNRFENAWTITNWLWGKDVSGSRTAWEAQWCLKEPIMSKDGRRQIKSKRGFGLMRIIGEKNPGEFVKTLPCYVFIATPIGDPPEPEIVRVPLTPEQSRQYKEMEEQSLTWIASTKGLRREPLVADLPVTQRIRLRTAALGGMTLVPGEDEKPDTVTFEPGSKSNKLDALYEVLHRPSWVGKKALILTHSKPFAKEVARRIGQKYSVALKVGQVSSKRWEADKERFMLPVSETDSIQYLVAVISAVGTATDGLQENCSKVVWLSEDDNNANNIQGANRVWREGVDLDDYEAVKLVSIGTIDEDVSIKNKEHKARTMDSVKG